MMESDPEMQFKIGSTPVGIRTIVSGLDVPWQLKWGYDGNIWFTEQSGTISKVNPRTGNVIRLLTIENTVRDRTAGLLGMDITEGNRGDPYVVIFYIGYAEDDSTRFARVTRYTHKDDTLVDPLTILEYPARTGHFGARVTFGPDGTLLAATGDGAPSENPQDISSPKGKILRLNIDGSIPVDNPVPGSPVWAWGMRNPQGLVYANGRLYNSDHGDATDDEVNLISKGANYGWPHITGFVNTDKERVFAADSVVTDPLKAWTPTIAPSGMAYYHMDQIPEFSGSLLLATLKGNSLIALKLKPEGDVITQEHIYFEQVFGRLRSVCVSPSGEVFIATSNKDWNPNGFAETSDDRIIRLYKLPEKQADSEAPSAEIVRQGTDVVSKGELLYTSYCASCHKNNGAGIKGVYPRLIRSDKVNGASDSLLHLIINGKNEMPAFAFLTDKELAIILTYVRKRFGPRSEAISEMEVKSVRKERF